MIISIIVFVTGFLCVALTALELALQTKLGSNSQRSPVPGLKLYAELPGLNY